MAPWQIQRRILSLLASTMRQTSITRECYSQTLLAANALFYKDALYNRRFQTLAEANEEAVEDGRKNEGGNIEPNSSSIKAVSGSVNSQNTLKHKVISNLKISTRHDLAMVFTCKVCDTRNMKTASRESYEKGVVVARCGGCNNLHLIADRLGWFGEPGSIEEFLAARGEEVKKGSAETLNLTLEDLAGRMNLET